MTAFIVIPTVNYNAINRETGEWVYIGDALINVDNIWTVAALAHGEATDLTSITGRQIRTNLTIEQVTEKIMNSLGGVHPLHKFIDD